MATPRTDKIFGYLKSSGAYVWFRYAIDDAGAYQFLFQTGTSGADQTLVNNLIYFQNVLNYPGATNTTGSVIDPALIATVTFPDGSAAAPSITFTNETSTGFFRAGTGDLGVSILGVMVADWTADYFRVVQTSTNTPRGIIDDQYNNGTSSAQFNARKARGTAAVPATIVTGDVLSRYIAWGHDGTQFIESGNIRFTSSGTIATNRVPSQIEFYTSTNAGPSVLTLAGSINSAQQLLWGNGTAALPSHSFTNGTTDGLYWSATGQIGLALNGLRAFFFQTNGGNPILNGPAGAGSITFPSAGGLNFTANGSNQPITATPSGTGEFTVILGGGSAQLNVTTTKTSATVFASIVARFATNASGADCTLQLTDATLRNYYIGLNSGNLNLGHLAGTVDTQFTLAGHVLFGGLLVDGTGLIQLPTGTTAAGGITLGNCNIFQTASGQFALSAAGTNCLIIQSSALQIAVGNIKGGNNALVLNLNDGGGTPDYVQISNTNAGGNAMISGIGGSTDISLTLTPKGAGNVVIAAGKALKLGNARAAGVLVQGGSVTMLDSAGATITVLTT